MVLDTFHIDLINQSNETLYFYRQFTNCYKVFVNVDENLMINDDHHLLINSVL